MKDDSKENNKTLYENNRQRYIRWQEFRINQLGYVNTADIITKI